MNSHDATIKRSLMKMILLTSGAVLLLACGAFIVTEIVVVRQGVLRSLTTLGAVMANNSTAALAFDDKADAHDVLQALRTNPRIVAAVLYDKDGKVFASYPDSVSSADIPPAAHTIGTRFENGEPIAVLPVIQGENKSLGTLYLRSNMSALYERLRLYGWIVALIFAVSSLLAYMMSRRLQHKISSPLLALAETARTVSERRDYSVRAASASGYELRLLTGTFNEMLERIETGQRKSEVQLGRLHLLQRITRAIGERQDLRSIFQVVLRTLEDNLPIDFCCVCLYEPGSEVLTVTSIGGRSDALAAKMEMSELAQVPIDKNGLSRCVRGSLVYEPDVSKLDFPFPQRMASGGLRSLVAAPLLAESRVFGVLLTAREAPEGFSSADCEFLLQLSEHVALAAHQTQLYTAIQQAYDDLRQSQHTVMQQERLRALGQMASGIAHDINNAISPVALYTESLLEREPNLSERARNYLTTIQRAIDDVAQTVARMREFYRQREQQLVLTRVDLNKLVQQTLELTRARWRDQPQEQGLQIDLRTDLAMGLPTVMGAEGEIRDALTNLIFNALDAMPAGGTLIIRTRAETLAQPDGEPPIRQVRIDVSDSGIGMDDETRRRCLEPFYTTKGERGTGLGLAMVFGMVQRHSAGLDITSSVGVGTTVSLTFAAAIENLSPIERTPAAQLRGRRLRLLIVDDDPLLIKSLRDTLESDGHAVTVADGGQAGIDTFLTCRQRGEQFDAVITDLGMPYVDGRKVAAAVKTAAPLVPVIMLTGWGQRMMAENDIPAHVDRLLSKPPKLHELRATLAELAVAEVA